jgi:hypothetical protein
MSDHEEHPVLVAVATTIADGLPVDWQGLTAAHPELEADLQALRVLQEVERMKQGGAEGSEA